MNGPCGCFSRYGRLKIWRENNLSRFFIHLTLAAFFNQKLCKDNSNTDSVSLGYRAIKYLSEKKCFQRTNISYFIISIVFMICIITDKKETGDSPAVMKVR